MGKVGSALETLVAKAVAGCYRIAPVVPASQTPSPDPTVQRRLFDKATERQRLRESTSPGTEIANRGWAREDLYDGRSR